ncbi:uncharacterized protein HD556DRAFT_1436950 [Suillus plorans]|uniref:Uncharacterized protein n=1 Tax=Suillus plorans TaxID=116603 RepID=A0A9P7DWP1_9AGAM|nr:uncharacterized protein HD556DRAFT_1436950 [Suillus plorans]KAG1804774.1 hypothetical protein HD556DRAFT_1436950 [Suillus plorans]
MQSVEGITANSQANLSPLSEIICALQTVLARCEVTIPDLETQHSKFPNIDQSAMDADGSIGGIVTKRQEQLDTVLREISGLETVMDGAKKVYQQLAEKRTASRSRCLCAPAADWSMSTIEGGCCRHAQFMEQAWEPQAFGYGLLLKRSRRYPLSLTLFCEETDAMKIRSLLQPYIRQISTLPVTFGREVHQPELCYTTSQHFRNWLSRRDGTRMITFQLFHDLSKTAAYLAQSQGG